MRYNNTWPIKIGSKTAKSNSARGEKWVRPAAPPLRISLLMILVRQMRFDLRQPKVCSSRAGRNCTEELHYLVFPYWSEYFSDSTAVFAAVAAEQSTVLSSSRLSTSGYRDRRRRPPSRRSFLMFLCREMRIDRTSSLQNPEK